MFVLRVPAQTEVIDFFELDSSASLCQWAFRKWGAGGREVGGGQCYPWGPPRPQFGLHARCGGWSPVMGRQHGPSLSTAVVRLSPNPRTLNPASPSHGEGWKVGVMGVWGADSEREKLSLPNAVYFWARSFWPQLAFSDPTPQGGGSCRLQSGVKLPFASVHCCLQNPTHHARDTLKRTKSPVLLKIPPFGQEGVEGLQFLVRKWVRKGVGGGEGVNTGKNGFCSSSSD